MSNLEQIIARQEEKFDKLLLYYRCYDCKEEEVALRAKLKDFHSSSIKEILEGIVEIEKKDIGKAEIEDLGGEAIADHAYESKFQAFSYGYEEAKSDTINHLENIIKQLK